MKLLVIAFIVVFQLHSGWSEEEPVVVAEKVKETSPKKENKSTGQVDTTDKSTDAKSTGQEKKSEEIDDFSLPSLNLFPLLDPNMTSKLPPLPVGAHTPPAKRYVNGRYVITRVPRPVVSKKPQMEMRKIRGKWVIGLKN